MVYDCASSETYGCRLQQGCGICEGLFGEDPINMIAEAHEKRHLVGMHAHKALPCKHRVCRVPRPMDGQRSGEERHAMFGVIKTKGVPFQTTLRRNHESARTSSIAFSAHNELHPNSDLCTEVNNGLEHTCMGALN